MTAAHRFRYTLAAGATAVVIGAGFTAVGIGRGAGAESAAPASVDGPLAPASPSGDAQAQLMADLPAPTLSGSPSASLSAPASRSASATPSGTASPTPHRTRPTKRTTAPTPRRTTARPDSPPQTSGSVAEQVLAHINAARAAEGLGALRLDADLSRASALHTRLMIDGCGLSHQCSGEGGIGDRFSDQGVKWSAAGENIGYGSSAAGDAAMVKAANGLTDSMLAEKPPNDGHRKNLLNAGYQRIGLSIVRDGKGITWMTQDFVN